MGLPSELNPTKACQAGQVISGQLTAKELNRLKGVKAVKYCFNFGLGELGAPEIFLDLIADCTLQCQRCNQPMLCHVNEHLKLDEPEVFDPIVVIEDELILALPMIPMHQEKDCSFPQNEAYYAAKSENKTYKPFADLSKMLK